MDWVQTEPPLYVVDLSTSFVLDSLADVMGATAAPTDSILTKDSDGQWRAVALSESSVVGYRYDQAIPAAVWMISHNLGRYPAGVSLYSLDLSIDYDEFIVQHLDLNSLRISMDIPTAGVALMI